MTEIVILVIFSGLYFYRNSPEKFKYQMIGKLMVVTIFIIFGFYIAIGLLFTLQSLRGVFKKKEKELGKQENAKKRKLDKLGGQEEEQAEKEAGEEQRPEEVRERDFSVIYSF